MACANYSTPHSRQVRAVAYKAISENNPDTEYTKRIHRTVSSVDVDKYYISCLVKILYNTTAQASSWLHPYEQELTILQRLHSRTRCSIS